MIALINLHELYLEASKNVYDSERLTTSDPRLTNLLITTHVGIWIFLIKMLLYVRTLAVKEVSFQSHPCYYFVVLCCTLSLRLSCPFVTNLMGLRWQADSTAHSRRHWFQADMINNPVSCGIGVRNSNELLFNGLYSVWLWMKMGLKTVFYFEWYVPQIDIRDYRIA